MHDDTSDEKEKVNDDVEFTETNEEGEEGAFRDKVKQVREKLKICEKERQEYLDGWQRAKADFINARREEEKTRGDFIKFSKGDFLRELLPVLDSFEMAFANKDAWEKVDSSWRKGVEYIYSQFETILITNGFKTIEPLGEPFNLELHTSVEIVPVDEEKDGKIVEVVHKGYTLEGRVVRPAKVKVGEYKK